MGVQKLLAMDAAQAAGLREEEQRLIDAFRVAGAVSPKRAQSLAQLALARTATFNRLETDRMLRLVGRNLYYLEESAIAPTDGVTAPDPAPRALLGALLLAVAVAIVAGLLLYAR